MAWRFRCNLRFQPGSGMAAWAKAQNDVRLGQAYHLNEGALNEERSAHSIEADTYIADFIFPEKALADDTFATMTAGSVTAWLRPNEGEVAPGVEGAKSWVDVHECAHEQAGSCPSPTTRWPA